MWSKLFLIFDCIWACSKHPWRLLVHTKRSLIFIWSSPKPFWVNQICSWTFWHGSDFKLLVSWTRCLMDILDRTKYSTRVMHRNFVLSSAIPKYVLNSKKKKKKKWTANKQMLQERAPSSKSSYSSCEMLTWVGARSYVSCWCFYVCSTLQERVTWLHGSK